MGMKVTSLYTGPDGESHFKDIEFPLTKGVARRLTELMKATGICFGEVDGDYKRDWHNASCREYVITLEGVWEIEIGDGTKRQFGPGDIVLTEDTTGRGHLSRAVQPQKRICVHLD